MGAASGDHDGIAGFKGIEFGEAIVRQQVEPGLTVDNLVRLRGGKRNAIARRGMLRSVKAVGLHQDVGNACGFKQHAAIRDNNQHSFHVRKCKLFTK